MKLKILMCLFCVLNHFSLVAQDRASTSIDYQFIIPKKSKQVEKYHYELLIDKIKSNYSGKIFFSNQSAFLVLPQIEILEEREAGEVQGIKVLKILISLTIEDAENNIVFNKYEKTLISTGDNAQRSISKAIAQIKSNELGLKNFFNKANDNITIFYKENCNKILKSAKVNVERREFNRAFDMLKYIPEDLDCFNEVEKLITSIYIANKDLNCKKLLQKAQIEEAKENYNQALHFLKFVDPDTDCYKDVSKLFSKIGSKVNNESLQAFEMEKLKFIKLTDLQKMKILAEQVDFLAVTVNN